MKYAVPISSILMLLFIKFCSCFYLLQLSPYIVSLIVCRIISFFPVGGFLPIDDKSSSSSKSGYYGLIALLLIPFSVGVTWYYCCCKRQIQTPGVNLEEQRIRQLMQETESADAQCATGIPSVTVAEEIMHDQQIVGDSHITIVSSAYVYQTAVILKDEEIALHSTGPLRSAEIVH